MARTGTLRADLLQSIPFSEERCDGCDPAPPGSESFTKRSRGDDFAGRPLPERRSRHHFLELIRKEGVMSDIIDSQASNDYLVADMSLAGWGRK